MRRLRYICCQPANIYFAWQVEVLINNFLKHNVNPNQIDIVSAVIGEVPPMWIKLQQHYNTVRFFFYQDTRPAFIYVPGIYFHLMAKHIDAHPELNAEALFLHDADIIFTREPQFEAMAQGDAWYLSDTNSYLNYDYIMSKGAHIYHNMCQIVGIDPLIPKLINHDAGGAQYIVKNTTGDFWRKVENDALNMYLYFCKEEHNHKPKFETDYPIQKWTAGMWSFLWNGWLHGHETIVDKRLSFAWATNDISEVEKHTILHNAGVTDNKGRMFYKQTFATELPYNKELDMDKSKASFYYWQEVQETAKKSVLL